MEVSRLVGAAVVGALGLPVDVHTPAFTIGVEIGFEHGVRLRRGRAGPGRPARRRHRPRRAAAVGRHRLARRRLDDDEARLPARRHLLPLVPLHRREDRGQGGAPRRAAGGVAARADCACQVVPFTDAQKKLRDASRRRQARGRALPAHDAARRRAHRAQGRRQGARHRRSARAGGVADAGEPRRHRRGDDDAGAAAVPRPRQARRPSRSRSASARSRRRSSPTTTAAPCSSPTTPRRAPSSPPSSPSKRASTSTPSATTSPPAPPNASAAPSSSAAAGARCAAASPDATDAYGSGSRVP